MAVNDNRTLFNSLAPGGCGNNFEDMVLKLIVQNNSVGSWCGIALWPMSQNLTDEKSTLVQVMTKLTQIYDNFALGALGWSFNSLDPGRVEWNFR